MLYLLTACFQFINRNLFLCLQLPISSDYLLTQLLLACSIMRATFKQSLHVVFPGFCFLTFSRIFQLSCTLLPHFLICVLTLRVLLDWRISCSFNTKYILFIERQKKKALKKFGVRTWCTKKSFCYRVVHFINTLVVSSFFIYFVF